MVYIILGEGFEEIEAVAPGDLLRRAGLEVRYAGIGGLEVTGSHRLTLTADCTIDEVSPSDMEMIVLPGGLRGVASIRANERALALTRTAFAQNRFVAAICAAPTILAELGITNGRRATCYPGMENQMGSAIMQDSPAVVDGKVITGRAAGAALDFGLELVRQLRGPEAAKKVADSVVYAR